MTILEKIKYQEQEMLNFLKVAPIAIPKMGLIAGFSLFDPKKIAPPNISRDLNLGDGDLIVRVWGYSARFVDLSQEMQEHIIARVGCNDDGNHF